MADPADSPAPEPQSDTYTAHAEHLIWAEWEEEYTVYNRATGDTHVFDPFPAEILMALGEQPADIPSLALRLADLADVECTPTWIDKTSDSVTVLVELELVDRVSPDTAGV